MNAIKPNLKAGIILSLFICLVLGLFPATSRAAFAEGINVVFMIWITTLARIVLLGGICVKKKMMVFTSRKHLVPIIMAGVVSALSSIFMMGAIYFISGSIVLIIASTNTLVLYAFLIWKKDTFFSFDILLSILFAIIGLSLVVSFWEEQSVHNLYGLALSFLAAASIAFRSYISQYNTSFRHPAVVGVEAGIVCMVCLLPLMLWQMPVLPTTDIGWFWTVVTCLSTGIGGAGIVYGIALTGAFRWQVLAYTQPIFTALFSVWFLGEYLEGVQYLGMVVVIGSLITYQVLSHRKEQRLAEVKAVAENGG